MYGVQQGQTSLNLSLCLSPLRGEGSSEEEASDEGETQTGGHHLQRHGHLEHRDPAALGHHVRLHVCVCVCVCRTHSVSVGVIVYLTHCVCVGRERGGSGSSGGRDFLPASGDECGASPSATS